VKSDEPSLESTSLCRPLHFPEIVQRGNTACGASFSEPLSILPVSKSRHLVTYELNVSPARRSARTLNNTTPHQRNALRNCCLPSRSKSRGGKTGLLNPAATLASHRVIIRKTRGLSRCDYPSLRTIIDCNNHRVASRFARLAPARIRSSARNVRSSERQKKGEEKKERDKTGRRAARARTGTNVICNKAAPLGAVACLSALDARTRRS